MSGIGRQAKIPSEHQQQALLAWLETRKYSDRNRLIVLLSFKAGLRAKEIASLKWSMVMKADGDIGDHIHLTNEASKGKSGRTIALNKELKKQLLKVKENEGIDHIIVLGDAHLRRILKSYVDYYNSVRTHRSLHKDAPIFRPIHQTGIIRSHPILGGLHGAKNAAGNAAGVTAASK
jgi:integrase